ncbi:MAG: SDR family NAD(P)-dependent oxidoreductase [Vicingaceae bacterium]
MKAIISGATRGIGRAIAKILALKGYDLILLARSEGELKKLAEELSQPQLTHIYYALDLTDLTQIKSLSEKLLATDSVKLLINNLGEYKLDQASNLKENELLELLEINLFSAINLTQSALPSLKTSNSSAIINIGSVMGLTASKEATAYSISKHAFKAWNDALREELKTNNIKVSCLYPGAVNTSSWDGTDANRGAMIQAEDIAKIVGNLVDLGSTCLVEEVRISPMNF